MRNILNRGLAKIKFFSSDLRDESISETKDTKRSSIDSSFEPSHRRAIKINEILTRNEQEERINCILIITSLTSVLLLVIQFSLLAIRLPEGQIVLPPPNITTKGD